MYFVIYTVQIYLIILNFQIKTASSLALVHPDDYSELSTNQILVNAFPKEYCKMNIAYLNSLFNSEGFLKGADTLERAQQIYASFQFTIMNIQGCTQFQDETNEESEN